MDALKSGSIQLVINTAREASAIRDSYAIRRHAVLGNIPYFTTISAALAVVDSLEAHVLLGARSAPVRSVQEWHARARRAASPE